MITVPYIFNGPEYQPERDNPRLKGQIHRVFDLMKDGAWRSLHVIAVLTGDPEASVSAQLRHLRKQKWGAHTVERRKASEPFYGLFEYRLVTASDVLRECAA